MSDATRPEECALHPGAPAVSACDGCGKGVCIACAVPVRGLVLGPDCLARELGPDLGPAPAAPRRRRALLPAAGAGFALATLATVLPWTRFGAGSGPLGAWTAIPRFSNLAAVASVIGLLLWSLRAFAPRRPARPWLMALRALALVVLAGSAAHILDLLRPPPFGHSFVGSWIALAGGIAALAGTFAGDARSAPCTVVARS